MRRMDSYVDVNLGRYVDVNLAGYGAVAGAFMYREPSNGAVYVVGPKGRWPVPDMTKMNELRAQGVDGPADMTPEARAVPIVNNLPGIATGVNYILGMPPMVAYGVGGVLALGAVAFALKKSGRLGGYRRRSRRSRR